MPSAHRTERRLLFLLPFAPRLDATHGGSRSLAEMLVQMATRHELALLCLRGADDLPVDQALKERCALVEEVPRPSDGRSILQRWLRRGRLMIGLLRGKPMWASDNAVGAFSTRVRELAQEWKPDIVQIEFAIMGQYIPALEPCKAPRVLADHDPGVEATRELLRSRHGLARLIQYLDVLAWERFERAIMRDVHTVVAVTERDRDALARSAGHTPVVRISVGTTLPELPLDPLGQPPPSLVFVGSFIHPPNVDAAARLISTIFPRVRSSYPESTLYIVGDQPPPEIQQMAYEGVIVTGRVPEVKPYLDRAAVVVVPLRLGGGMRVKVLEALAAGKAVVASPLAVEGLDLVSGEQIVLAEDDQQFCDAIIDLLGDPERRRGLASNARAWACTHLGWETVVANYEALYDSLLAQRS